VDYHSDRLGDRGEEVNGRRIRAVVGAWSIVLMRLTIQRETEEKVMMTRRILMLAMMFTSIWIDAGAQTKKSEAIWLTGIYQFVMEDISGDAVPLSNYSGNVLIIVNVASKCGYTPQYNDLEATYRAYKDRGLRILAFPANNFGNQEPGTNEEIKEFCSLTYDVTFDMFSKISVKGEDQHPLYRYITEESAVPGEIKWNFQKYLVNRRGEVVAQFPSRVKPTAEEFTQKLVELVKEAP